MSASSCAPFGGAGLMLAVEHESSLWYRGLEMRDADAGFALDVDLRRRQDFRRGSRW